MDIYAENRNIQRLAPDKVLYYGYTITKNGEIISPTGNSLNAYYFTYPYSHVTLKINDKSVKLNRAILIYELFSGEELKRNTFVIQFRDGNPANASFDNIYPVSKKEFWDEKQQRTGKKYGKSLTEEEKRTIIDEYKAGGQSFRKLSRKYNVCLATITKALQEAKNADVCGK